MSRLRESSEDEQDRLKKDFRARRLLELFQELPYERKEALMATLEKEAYNPEEVAQILGKSIETVRRWLRSGEITATKLGRSWIISRAELERILKRGASMIGIKVSLKGVGETDPRHDMTIIDMGTSGGIEKVRCSYIVSIPEGELGLDPMKIPKIEARYEWFPIPELEVTVYEFKAWDLVNDKYVYLKRPAIREVINRIRGAEILEDTAQVVPLSSLDGNYHLKV